MLESIRGGFDKFQIAQNGDFIGVRLPGTPSKAPEPMLRRLSEMFGTDVIWLSFQSAMDCLEYHHWRSAKLVRSLVYGTEEERTWERADGAPEQWECEILFHPQNMECELAEAQDVKQQTLIRRVYGGAKIEVGQIVPDISSKETADAIARHYGFPFFDLS